MNGGRLNRGRLPALVARGASRLGVVGLLLAGPVLAGSLTAGAAAVQPTSGPSWGGSGLAGSAGSQQGFSVAVSGNTAVVGAPGANKGTGSANVWIHNGGQPWHKGPTLSDPRKASHDEYGWAVAVASTKSATYVAVGGPDKNSQRDVVYIYEGSGKTWHLQATLQDPNSNSTDLFGAAMALSSTVLVIGAPGVAGNEGTVFIYDRSGTKWNEQAAEVDPGQTANDLFGRSVSASGNQVLVGAVGLAYIFTHAGGNQWTQTAVLPNKGSQGDNFAYAVNLDGTTAIIGAPGGVPGTRVRSPLSTGAAYVFTKEGSGWSAKKLTAPAGTKGDEFGISVSETGDRLVIGMPVYGKVNCGTAFVFAPDNSTWTFAEQLLDPNCTQGDRFGFSAALSGATGVIGAPDTNNGAGAVFFLSLPPTSPEAIFHTAGSTGVTAVAFAPNGSTLATGNFNGGTALWNVASRRRIRTLRNPDGQAVYAAVFSPDGKTLAVGTENSKNDNGSVYLWNVSSGRLIATLHDPMSRGIDALALNGTILALGDNNGSTYLWNVSSRKLIATLRDPASQGVNGVAFGPDGAILAVADQNGSTYLWNVSSRAVTATFRDPASKVVSGVAFSPDGTMLATADGNGHAYLWNVPSRKLIATLRDPASKSVNGVAFSPDGRALATSTTNETLAESGVCIWDVATKSLIATFHDPRSQAAYRIAYSPAGSSIAIGDDNARTYLWDMSWLGS